MESISNAKILLDYNLDHLRVSTLVVQFKNLLGLERCILQIVCNVEGSFTYLSYATCDYSKEAVKAISFQNDR